MSKVSVASSGNASEVSATPSPSSSVSELFPIPSESVSTDSAASSGKASPLSPTPSPSESTDSVASKGKASTITSKTFTPPLACDPGTPNATVFPLDEIAVEAYRVVLSPKPLPTTSSPTSDHWPSHLKTNIEPTLPLPP